MPYKIVRIGQSPFYHVINTETGHSFSNHGIPYDRALRQLYALHIHAHDTGTYSDGGSITFTNKLRTEPPPSVRKVFEQYANWKIDSIYVCREPISSAFSNILNLLTLGKFTQDKKKYNIDKFFHLYTIFTLSNNGKTVIIRLEKNEVISTTILKSVPEKLDGMYYHTNGKTFGDVIESAKKIMGLERFVNYSIYASNCQDFALALAQASGSVPPILKEFIKQDHIEELIPKESIAGKTAEKLSRWAGIFDHIFNGHGINF